MGREKIAILGGRGMLGTDVAAECGRQGIDFEIFDLPEFDITNESHLTEAVKNAGVVINCAAYTNVEKAESQAELAYKVNADAVGKLGVIAAQAGVWVLHIGTDFVFDGKSDRPYIETDAPNPINIYGKSKLAGERLLIESGCANCIMRLEWTYGRTGNNFVSKLIESVKKGQKLRVVDDQVGSPTATAEASKAILNLLAKSPTGLYHFAASGYVSRFETAKFIFEKLKMPVDLSSCKSSVYKTAAQRPLNSRFNCSKIEKLLGEPIKPWQKPLENFLRQI
jgi:dTDP-4-dehydrorhamnose reductase